MEGIQAEDAVKIIIETADEKGHLKDDGLCRTCLGTGTMTIQAQTCYICKDTGLCNVCGGTLMGTCYRCNGSGINKH